MSRCKVCGIIITDESICPFCNSVISEQYKISDNVIITEGLNEKFIDKNIDIKFNLRTIVNELDYKKDYENNVIELLDEQYQYLQSDITDDNVEKIKYIIKYYMDDLIEFKKNGKHKLETAGAEDLQNIIGKFNAVVNICNKYKKFVRSNKIKGDLDYVIRSYDEEVNYIKKYFVLPLYEADKILAASRLAKNLITVSTTFVFYFILSNLPFFQTIFTAIIKFFGSPGKEITKEMFMSDLLAVSSYAFSLGITEVIFAYYISFTIKNRNFKVDKHKNYEPIKYFVPVMFFISLYAPILTYIFNIVFMCNLIRICIQSFRQKRFSPQWMIVKIVTIIISLLILINILSILF